MKKSMIFVGLLAIGFANAQEYDGKVGINTNEPKATLDITPETNNLTGTTNEGILVPRLSKERVAKMVTPETSTLVYVNNITYTASNTATPADTRVALVDAVGYYQYNGTQWERIGGEPWKVYGTDKYATHNNQNIYQKGNVVATHDKDIPKELLTMGETGTYSDGGIFNNNSGRFYSYGVNGSSSGLFYGKSLATYGPNHISIMSRGRDNGQQVGARAGISLSVGGETMTTKASNFIIYKYGGSNTQSTKMEGAYLVNRDLYGGTIAFLENNTIQIRNKGSYFLSDQEKDVSFTILTSGNTGIGAIAPTNRLHVKATADPLKLEGLQASTTATDKILVADADGVVKTVEKSSIVSTTNSTVKATASEDTCTAANTGTFHYKERAVNGQQVGTMGFCTRQNGNYIWVYFSNGANVLQSAGTNKFGEGL